MAEIDWSDMNDSLSAGTLKRGVTAGAVPPLGGGAFVYGWNALGNNGLNPGVHGKYVNLANFIPTAANKGGSIRGAIKRALGSGNTDFAPMLVGLLQGVAPPSVNDQGYSIGLSDGDPCHIVLRKGTLITGVPDVSPGTSGVLRRSTDTFAPDTWLHLRLDIIVNLVGDVLLQCFKSDVTVNPVTAPVWTAIPGMASFTDDALGINSGSLPFTNGFFGVAFWMKNIGRRGFIDHIECLRQV